MANAHGDVVATLSNGSEGRIKDLYNYDEFGSLVYYEGETDNRIMYAGEYFDKETGNYYLKARYYDPSIGRFTQKDSYWNPQNMIYGEREEPEKSILPENKNRVEEQEQPASAEPKEEEPPIYTADEIIGYELQKAGAPCDYRAADNAPELREEELSEPLYPDLSAVLQSANLYVYCTNNPVAFVDPSGLFDYDTKLSYNQEYNVDVEVMQHKLVDLGYMKAPADGDWGYFGPKTQAAVNAYKDDNGLTNTGVYEGVVGVTTWSHMGLIYRSKVDIEKGVEIFTVNNREQYFDVTIPINNFIIQASEDAKSHKYNLVWFYKKVNHYADWDIKRKDSWNRTLEITYPGSYDSIVAFNGEPTTPEELGNFVYGYTGTALGCSENILIAGSIYASGIYKPDTSSMAYINEFNDHVAIRREINAYNEQ